MALTDKDIVITPNIGQADDPKIVFTGGDSTSSGSITARVYPLNNGTLSFEGALGQLFSVSAGNTGSLFSVNDTSGMPAFLVTNTGNAAVGVMTPYSRFQISGGQQAEKPTGGFSTESALFLTNTDPAYGMMFGVGGSGRGWIQQQRNDGTATQYDLLLNPLGGNIGINVSGIAPLAQLDLGTSYYAGTPATLADAVNKISLWNDGTNPAYGFGVSTGTLNITAGEAAGQVVVRTGGAVERFRINASGNIGMFGVTSPSNTISIGGDATRAIAVERRTTTNSPGANLTIGAGGATSGATDKSGGNLLLQSGISTGSGSSVIAFYTSSQIKSLNSVNTTDNPLVERGRFTTHGNFNIGTTSEKVYANLLVSQDAGVVSTTFVTANRSYKVVNATGSTLAQWQACFSSLSAVPSAGDIITSSGTATLAGGGTVRPNGATIALEDNGYGTGYLAQIGTTTILAGESDVAISTGASWNGSGASAATQRVRILTDNTIIIGQHTSSLAGNSISLNGNAARSIGLERHTTTNTAGNNLTILAGGATSGATDKAGGQLILSAGTSTGTGSSSVAFYAANSSATGTGSNVPGERARITGDGTLLVGTIAPGIAENNAAALGTGWAKLLVTNGGGYTNYGVALGNSNGGATLQFFGNNNASTPKRIAFSSILGAYLPNTAGSEKSILTFSTMSSGATAVERARFTQSGNFNIGTGADKSWAHLLVSNTSNACIALEDQGSGTGYLSQIGAVTTLTGEGDVHIATGGSWSTGPSAGTTRMRITPTAAYCDVTLVTRDVQIDTDSGGILAFGVGNLADSITHGSGPEYGYGPANSGAIRVKTSGGMTWFNGASGYAGINTLGDMQIAGNFQTTALGVGTGPSATIGEIRATNNITAYYSDARLKTFEGTISNALDKVLKLNGYYFRENETAKSLGYNNDKRQVGVSAQEVADVLPEVVTDAPINGNIEGADYKTVYYDKLVPLLIEAIKEQNKKISNLEEKISLLVK